MKGKIQRPSVIISNLLRRLLILTGQFCGLIRKAEQTFYSEPFAIIFVCKLQV